LLFTAANIVSAAGAFAQSARSEATVPAGASGTTAAGVVPLPTAQPPARLIVDPPLAAPLAPGVVVLEYRTENIRIVPVFGQAALERCFMTQ